MPLTVTNTRQIAAEVAHELNLALDVVAAIPSNADSTYTEVVVTLRGCHVEPCSVMIGVDRNASERECRTIIRTRLQQHLAEQDAAGRDSLLRARS